LEQELWQQSKYVYDNIMQLLQYTNSIFIFTSLLSITLIFFGSSVVGRRGWYGRKLKLKKSKPENGHIALRMELPMKLRVTIYGLNFASYFCNLLAKDMRQDPFVLRVQPLEVNLLSHCWHANKHCFPKRNIYPVSVFEYPKTFLRAQSGIEDGIFHFLVPGIWHFWLIGKAVPTRCQWTCQSNRGSCFSRHTEDQVSVAQKYLEKAWKPIGNPTCQTGKNPGSNNRPAFGRQEGSRITSQRHLSSSIQGETVSL
jgi:hypothetical protein